MNRKTRKLAVAFALPACLIVAATAYANAGVRRVDMNGVKHAVKSDGSLKANAVGHLQLKSHIVSCEKLTSDLRNALCKGAFAAASTSAGKHGQNGVDGKTGADGARGLQGERGEDGQPGRDAPAREYGIAQVFVSRSAKTATPWATYSTLLGAPAPVGDTTSGTFRFTCSDAQAPCTIALKAGVISPNAGAHTVYPRVLVYREDYNAGGPSTECEYVDGSTGAAPASVANAPVLSLQALTLNIGGTADCNGPVTTAGDVPVVTVPSGFYDVTTTVAFQ